MKPDLRLAVIERDRAHHTGEIHHILGRQKPRGWKSLPDPLKTAWPDVPMNLIVLPLETHRPFAHISGREAQQRLLLDLLERCGDETWGGRTYRRWLLAPPFSALLGDCTNL